MALPARLEPWQLALCDQPVLLAEWLDRHGSPLNVLDPAPLARNAGELQHAAAHLGVDLKIFFARKANKALTLVDEARRLGLGIDVASERELRQALARHVPASNLIVTAAVKPRPLLQLCADCGATVVIDNEDELRLLAEAAEHSTRSVPVALRLAPVHADGRALTRFGLPSLEMITLVDRYWPAVGTTLEISGVHFHLDGYAAADRVTALTESLEVVDALRERGHHPRFVDIGGGIPISYLDDAAAWERFWSEHRAALLGRREPLTFEGHGLGLTAHAGEIIGHPNLYPYYQEPTRGRWLARVLQAEVHTRTGTQTAAEALRARGMQLRCEPGRSLVDGCGLTAARVEFRKQRPDDAWLIGVAMNRTQCRSTSDDFLVDPLLLRPPTPRPEADTRPTGAIEGYLVGAYCIERELLTWRRMRFPRGVDVGDIVVFPNTAGYLMHILESASHQIPLARNLVVGSLHQPFLDPIDVEPNPKGHSR
ncbi:MAG: Y4yA family PLP-dependent enzyme [Actinomycetota bacterium]|nr:Y4yA family PLP-dependent enzyme [Actinomycetota bacterium]